jgi:adhesin/invasin
MVGTPVSAAIQDVQGTRFEDAVTYLNRLGVVEGRPLGFFPLEPITRAEATKIVVEILGRGDLAELIIGAPSFIDVAGSHWASGYIAVARNLGIVNGYPDGMFRPEGLVTYAEYAKMLVEAAGLKPTSGYAWPLNYIDPATQAGMLVGTVFAANASAIRGDCAIMTATTVRSVRNPITGVTLGQSVFGESNVATIELSPGSETAAVGSAVDFAVVVKDADGLVVVGAKVTYTTSNATRSSISESGRFTATHAGIYTVTATVGSQSATATVNVYGTATALKVTASPTSITANGKSTSTLTVHVVDSNGIRVPTATNSVSLSYDINNGAVSLPTATTENASGGAVAFTVTSTLLSGVTDTLVVTASGLTSDTCTVKTVEPKATSFRLTAEPTQLPANEAMSGFVTAEVLDQTGEPMTFGTYYFTFSITGKGYLEGDTESITVATIDQKAVVEVSSWAGDAGTMRVTATSTSGLGGSRSVSISTYIAGEPKSIRVTLVDVKGEAGAEQDMKVTVGLFDSSNRPAIAHKTYELEMVLPDGSGLVGLGDLTFVDGESYQTIEFSGTAAGTFTVTVKDKATTSALSSATFTCTVTSGQVDQIGLTPSGEYVTYIARTDPRLSLTAQLEDAHGNPVAKSGVRLQFSATVGGTGSVTWSATNGKVVTNASGAGTITMNGLGYVGNEYTVTVRADLDNDGSYDDMETTMAPANVVVLEQIPDSFTIVYRNEQGQLITSLPADASKTATATLQVVDKNGVAINRTFDLEMSFANGGRNILLDSLNLTKGSDLTEDADVTGRFALQTASDGQAVFEFQAGLAASFAINLKCLNTSPVISRSLSFRTTAGSAIANAMVLRTDMTPATEVTYRANTSVSVRVALVDNGGNPVAAPGATVVYLSPADGGQYRLTSTGTAVTELDFAKGAAYRALYYRNEVAGTSDLSHDATDFEVYGEITLEISGTSVIATARAVDGNPVVGSALLLVGSGGVEFGGGATEYVANTNSSGKVTVSYTGTGSVSAYLVDARNLVGGSPVEIPGATVSIP